jgi:hypothetical protein
MYGLATTSGRGNLRGSNAGTAKKNKRRARSKWDWLSSLGVEYYIFGYGSLMSESSRIRTQCKLSGISEDNLEWITSTTYLDGAIADEDTLACIRRIQANPLIAVELNGVRRGWYAQAILDEAVQGPEWADQKLFITPTYLGAVADPDSSTYGYIYPVTKKELELTDEREQAGYDFITLTASDLRIVAASDPNFKLSSNVQIRAYLNPEIMSLPSERSPIVQSYVDVFIGGALDIEAKLGSPGFALKVCQSTFGWGEHWLNDRSFPYRPFSANKNALHISELLLECANKNNDNIDAYTQSEESTTPLLPETLQGIILD